MRAGIREMVYSTVEKSSVGLTVHRPMAANKRARVPGLGGRSDARLVPDRLLTRTLCRSPVLPGAAVKQPQASCRLPSRSLHHSISSLSKTGTLRACSIRPKHVASGQLPATGCQPLGLPEDAHSLRNLQPARTAATMLHHHTTRTYHEHIIAFLTPPSLHIPPESS